MASRCLTFVAAMLLGAGIVAFVKVRVIGPPCIVDNHNVISFEEWKERRWNSSPS